MSVGLHSLHSLHNCSPKPPSRGHDSTTTFNLNASQSFWEGGEGGERKEVFYFGTNHYELLLPNPREGGREGRPDASEMGSDCRRGREGGTASTTSQGIAVEVLATALSDAWALIPPHNLPLLLAFRIPRAGVEM